MTTNLIQIGSAIVVAGGLGVAGLGGCASGGGDASMPGDDEPVGEGPDAGDEAPGGEPLAPENLIDDLDDGDGSILLRGGRVGAWYTYNDMSVGGEQTPAAGTAFAPTAADAGQLGFFAGTHGEGFSVWGAGMGFDLNATLDIKSTYDASAYQGVQFRAKGSGPVRAVVMVASVLASTAGGECQPSATPGEGCDDGHGSVLLLSSAWTTYRLPFAQIRQAGWGKVVPFDSTQVMAVQFNVDKNLVFDVAVDDIGFY